MFKITLKFKTGRVMTVYAHAGMEVVQINNPVQVKIEEVVEVDDCGEEVYATVAFFRNCSMVWLNRIGVEVFDLDDDDDDRSIAIIHF